MCVLFTKQLYFFRYKSFLFSGFFIFINCVPTFAQTILAPDSLLQQKRIAALHEMYIKNIGANLAVYNGKEYHQEKYSTIGHPFFLSDSTIIGSIMYKNILYKNVHIQLDIASDILIIKDEYQSNGLVVQSNFVPYFTIGNHRFEYLTSTNDDIVPTGFYERITGTTTALFVKRTKKFEQALKAEDNTTKFVENNAYFLITKNRFYGITNKKSLLKFLADKKELLQQFITDNKINFNKDVESAFEKTISYYNKIKYINETDTN